MGASSGESSSPKSSLFNSYVILISVSLVMIASGGSRSAFGVFFNPMANDFGWSAAELSGTFSFSMIIEGVVSAISGRLSDKFGARTVLTFSAIISSIGFILMSIVHTTWQMYLIYGLAMGIGLGGIVVPVVSILARRFTSSRSLMTGIALSANGLGQLIAPLIAYQLISNYDWRTSYIILGIILLILIGIPAQFIKRPRRKIEAPLPVDEDGKEQLQHMSGTGYSFSEAIRTRLFWMMMVMFACYGYCFLSLLVHIVPYAISVGIPASTAAGVLAVMGGFNILGKLSMGSLADRIGNRRVMTICLTITIISMLWLLQAKEPWALYIFSIACGFGMGGFSTSQSPLSAQYFGSKAHGSIFGLIGGGTVSIAAFGPLVAGYLYDLTGRYQVSFIVCIAVCLAALVISLIIRHPDEIKKMQTDGKKI
jgi:MFS family permease